MASSGSAATNNEATTLSDHFKLISAQFRYDKQVCELAQHLPAACYRVFLDALKSGERSCQLPNQLTQHHRTATVITISICSAIKIPKKEQHRAAPTAITASLRCTLSFHFFVYVFGECKSI